MQPTLEQKNIEMDIILKDPDLTLEIDTNLMEQVLINLILNATEAVKEVAEPRILLSANVTANNNDNVNNNNNNNIENSEKVHYFIIIIYIFY